jgi:hypothetical protein
MSRRAKTKSGYIPDPDRRAYLNALRTIRNQVYREHEKEFEGAGLFKRLLLRFRIEGEIRKRARDIHLPPR